MIPGNKNPIKTAALWTVALFFLVSIAPAQTAPVLGLHQNTPNVVAFTNAFITISPETVLEDAVLVVRDGIIEAVGVDIAIPLDAVVRDVDGLNIYPGFIDLYTHYGVSDSAAGTAGGKRTSAGPVHWNQAVHPERRAVDRFRPDKKAAAAMRKAGFTTALTSLPDGYFRGSAALVLPTDSLANPAVLREEVAQVISLRGGGGYTAVAGEGGYPRSLQGIIALIRQTFYDADWYRRAMAVHKANPTTANATETDLSLDALIPSSQGGRPVLFEVDNELDLLRAARIGSEFKLKLMVRGGGSEYRRLQAVRETGVRLIIPLNFPKAPDVSTAEVEMNVNLRQMRHWYFAPENPARLADAGIDFALTGDGLKSPDLFLTNLRTAVKRGLAPQKALAALTTTPAAWLGVNKLIGGLHQGALANFFLADGDIFEPKTKIVETWVRGERFEVTPRPRIDVRGTYALKIQSGTTTIDCSIDLSGDIARPAAQLTIADNTIKATKVALDGRRLSVAFPADSVGFPGVARLAGLVEETQTAGQGLWGDGSAFSWTAVQSAPYTPKPDSAKTPPPPPLDLAVLYPEGAFGRDSPLPPTQPEHILVRNATIWTCGPDGLLEDADLLVRAGKIARIGTGLKAPRDALVIDAAGKHVTPGIIDAHSHIATARGVNEGTHAITSETRIQDVIDCDDINIYRQLAGGVTASCVIHGSANPIGGQYAIIKLRWGGAPDELIVTPDKPGIKFALGENVKQSNWGRGSSSRYPQTRMGVEQLMRDNFAAADAYRKKWDEYRSLKNKASVIPPRKDLRLDPLVEILDKNMIIHCHSYRQDEILATLRLAEELGFKIDVLIHILEGYKLADDIRRHGAMPTTFSDWWAYKFEVYDAIPYNGALMFDQGLTVSFNSDDAELARRLNTEAAKAVKYGGVPHQEALKFVTINAARQLYLHKRIGSLEPGKDADFVIWNGSPLSTYSICEQTWIDGRRYFDRDSDAQLRLESARQRALLTQRILTQDKKKGPPGDKGDPNNKPGYPLTTQGGGR
ncbi:amidohydrolase family protein [candidate division KSB1 bacterium]